MNETPFHPDDPALGISRQLDGDLTEGERRRLDEALIDSEELRRAAADYQAVDRLVRRWGRGEVELDWGAFAANVLARVADGEADEQLGEVDRLLVRWGGRSPEVDEGRFTAGVMSKVAKRSAQRRLVPRLIRIAVPLAAAAMIAVAVTGMFFPSSTGAPLCEVVVGPASRIVAPGSAPLKSEHTVVVAYARAAVDEPASRDVTRGLSMASVGSSPWIEITEEAPPL